MLGVTGGTPAFADPRPGQIDSSDQVQAVVAWFPPTNFLKMDELLAASGLAPRDEEAHSGANSPESLLLGKRITEIPEQVRAANPETYIHPAIPPMLLQHGTGDEIVPYQQSVEFTEKARQTAGPGRIQLDLLGGAGHGDDRFGAAENVNRVLDFIDASLK
jgi:acetyl esterase/lipase